MATRIYILAQETITQNGEDVIIPKYTDQEFIDGFSTAQIQSPDIQAVNDTLGTTAGDTLYIARLEATSAEFEAFETNVSDVIRVTDGTADVMTVTPSQVAQYLNEKFRPQSWAEFKASRDDLRDLTAAEWGEQLGLTGGF